jgi:hypothetical protein
MWLQAERWESKKAVLKLEVYRAIDVARNFVTHV